MSDLEPAVLAEQAVLLGLITQDQAREAIEDAEDGSLDSLTRSFLRKGMLTSWQVEKFKKSDLRGFFYGGCKVLFHLAEGTFARVYRGIKSPGQQAVAIKVLRNRFVSDATAVERFNKEAEAGTSLVHPNIVQIYLYGEEEGRHYMIMEYVEGSNLRDFLKIRKRISLGEALPMMLGLSRALKYSLDHGVTHRDIKGTNILIASNGIAKLVDFGLATIGGDEKRIAYAHGQRTVDYSALERTCNSPKGDPRSDIFFLGCVFYQMLTGQLPMPEIESKDLLAKMLKRSFGAIKPISEQRHAPRKELADIIEKMMKVDVKARYQSMDEVLRELEAFEALLGKPSDPGKPLPRRSRFIDSELGAHEEIFDYSAFEAAPVELKNVLCVEVQSEIQEAFRKALSRMGCRMLLVSDAERAAERYRESPTDAVVYDADGLGAEALEAFLDMHEKAHEDGHKLSALVLLGVKQGDLKDKLPTDDRLIILSKPIKMGDVQDALSKLLPVG